MKRSFKSAVIAGVSILAVTASLSGCSASSGDSKDKVLTLWTFKQSEVSALEKAGAEWGKDKGMTVKVTAYPENYLTKVQSAAKGHTLPDIVSVHSQGEDWTMAQAGIIKDLTSDFTSDWQKEFLPGVVSGLKLTDTAIKNSGSDPATTIKDLKPGHFYEIPYLAGTPGVVFARKSLLTAAGVDASKVPSTWEEWVSQIKATKAVDPATGGLVTGMQIPETGYYWLYRPMAYAFLGADAFYGRQGRDATPSWDSPDSIKTLDLYNQLTDLWSPGVLALGIDPADQAFASGKAAWDVGGTYTLSSLTAFGLKSDDVSVFPVPTATGGKLKKITYQASPLVGGAVSSTSKHSAEALSFLKYLTSTKGAQTFATVAQDLPATSIPVEGLKDPLLRQLVGLVGDDPDAFNPNDFSADPGGQGPTTGATAKDLSGLVAKTTTVPALATQLKDLYATAWKTVK